MIAPRIPLCHKYLDQEALYCIPKLGVAVLLASELLTAWWGTGTKLPLLSSASDLEGPVSVLILVNPDSSLQQEPPSETNKEKIEIAKCCSRSELFPNEPVCPMSCTEELLLLDIHNISLMLCIQTESLCFCISLGLIKNNSDICMCRSAKEIGKIPKTNSVLAWRLSGSLSPQQPLPPLWIGVIVQCNHIMPHLNIHSRDKALEDKGGVG
ncbi:Hypothetical predicted protein, partial [Lynx pardinus]